MLRWLEALKTSWTKGLTDPLTLPPNRLPSFLPSTLRAYPPALLHAETDAQQLINSLRAQVSAAEKRLASLSAASASGSTGGTAGQQEKMVTPEPSEEAVRLAELERQLQREKAEGARREKKLSEQSTYAA